MSSLTARQVIFSKLDAKEKQYFVNKMVHHVKQFLQSMKDSKLSNFSSDCSLVVDYSGLDYSSVVESEEHTFSYGEIALFTLADRFSSYSGNILN
jgi:hypothetical protein